VESTRYIPLLDLLKGLSLDFQQLSARRQRIFKQRSCYSNNCRQGGSEFSNKGVAIPTTVGKEAANFQAKELQFQQLSARRQRLFKLRSCYSNNCRQGGSDFSSKGVAISIQFLNGRKWKPLLFYLRTCTPVSHSSTQGIASDSVSPLIDFGLTELSP
jgi:hypothetical protein